jgi:hypothetical protein
MLRLRLVRYQIEYDPSVNSKLLSQKYYFMAIQLMPENGMPLNQLGTLASSKYYGCDSAYYYIYCMSCVHAFQGAKENLKLLFVKNRKRYEEIKQLKYLDPSNINNYQLKELHAKEIKRFLVLFLHIIDSFLSSTLNTAEANRATSQTNTNYVQELCQMCLQEFNACMFFKHENSRTARSNEKLTYLPNDLVFKLTLIALMTIERMKKYKYSSRLSEYKSANIKQENTLLFTAIAFSFVFFSHVVNHTIIRFHNEIINLQKPQRLNPGTNNLHKYCLLTILWGLKKMP